MCSSNVLEVPTIRSYRRIDTWKLPTASSMELQANDSLAILTVIKLIIWAQYQLARNDKVVRN